VSAVSWCSEFCVCCAPTATFEELVADAASLIDLATVFECEVDGVALEDLGDHRFVAPPFTVTLREGALFRLPSGPRSPVASDGFWVMVAPLPPGERTIHSHGVIGDPGVPLFETEVTYSLTLE